MSLPRCFNGAASVIEAEVTFEGSRWIESIGFNGAASVIEAEGPSSPLWATAAAKLQRGRLGDRGGGDADGIIDSRVAVLQRGRLGDRGGGG